MTRLYIVAGEARQAEYWANDQEIPEDRWNYVYSGDRLRGLREPVVMLVGTWYARRDWDEMYDYLCAIDAILVRA